MKTNKNSGLKLVLVADTHGALLHDSCFAAFMQNVKEYDLCILLGDIDYCDIEKILEIVPKEKILALRGNHDTYDLKKAFGLSNLHRKSYVYKGIRFVGFEGAFKHNKSDAPTYTQEKSQRVAKRLPKRADVLLTHDGAYSVNAADKAHMGLMGIAQYIQKNDVKLHIHGHFHKSYSSAYCNGTAEKCVYMIEYLEI